VKASNKFNHISRASKKHRDFLLSRVVDQIAWIDEHGKTIAGYRMQYAVNADEIFQADWDALRRYEKEYHAAI